MATATGTATEEFVPVSEAARILPGPPLSGSDLLSEDEAAEYLGISRKTMWNERRLGRIGFARVAGKIRYRAADIEAYLNRNYHAATA